MAPTKQQELLPSYDERFLEQHVGTILNDPIIAAIELVANAWDAGAVNVKITWPDAVGDRFEIQDDGIGMTYEEFSSRWLMLHYNRQRQFDDEVTFPPGVRKNRRVAFGRNGIGRHAMFCFSDSYTIDTRKGGSATTATVRRAASGGRSPFEVAIERYEKAGHGTHLRATTTGAVLPASSIADQLGAHFVTDPDFNITVNGRAVELTDLQLVRDVSTLEVEGLGTLKVSRFDTERAGRTSRPYGIAWWVNRRLVGRPGWGQLIDHRTSAAKRFTYIVEADQLAKHVKADWSDFRAADQVEQARRAVSRHVLDDLRGAMADVRRERKVAALADNRGSLREIPSSSQHLVARFVDEIQMQCPTIGDKELASTVMVLAKLEKARTGYSLLDRLSALSSDDLDGLDAVLDEWTVKDVREVMGELHYRLALLSRLEKLVEDKRADELHELQPLFERGLWMFGPEFESIEFMSNRTLKTVVEKFLVDASDGLASPQSRPDFVVLPDRSVGVYAADSHDERGEVDGFRKVVIVELKKGGFSISHEEKEQAQRYARELRKTGKVGKQTPIVAYVLGANVLADAADEITEGETKIVPRTYAVVLRTAHARTFNLLRRLESLDRSENDPDLVAAMTQGSGELF